MTPLRPRPLRIKRRSLQSPPPLPRRRSSPTRPKTRRPTLFVHLPRRSASPRRPLTVSPQRSNTIVRHHALSKPTPQGIERLARIPSTHPIMQILKERSPLHPQILNNLTLPLTQRPQSVLSSLFPLPSSLLYRPQLRKFLRQIKPNPSIPLPQRLKSNPHHLARRNQQIQITCLIPHQPSRQNLRLQNRSRYRSTL